MDREVSCDWWRIDSNMYRPYSWRMRTPTGPISKGVEEARQQLPSILAAAAAGRSTIITRHGREVAAVVPAVSVTPLKPRSLMALAGSGRGLWGKRSAQTIARLRDQWRR